MLLCFHEGDASDGAPESHEFALGVHSLSAQWLLETYGDVIYVDGTHGVNKRQHPNLAVLVVDSENHGHHVASFVVMREATADITVALESLKRLAPAWSPQAVVMDKSDATRAAAKAVWPDCKVVVCRWHANRAVEEFCRGTPGLQPRTALIKYHLSYLMRSRTVAELEHLDEEVCAKGYFKGLHKDITPELEGAIVGYIRGQWVNCERWKEASIDCYVGKLRCGGTNMHIESFFRHSKDTFGGTKAQRKRVSPRAASACLVPCADNSPPLVQGARCCRTSSTWCT